ncbi:rootletin-like [Gopherus evgoodei]|uniref:rootletin-like n=1 Tax=Gopherus evgoodei TaxID=1825980 RepID=UPI0011CEFB35|nr:rootletin-like [Gopherus evgoodei]
MSWPGEAWQEGLPARALQGVRELEQRLEWANKERVQKQAQLDTLEAALHKQRQKHEEERGTWVLLARERRDLAEACERLECGRQQLSRELQAKGAQLNQLERQLGRAAQRIEELEEELRRCQAELDNLHSSTPLTHCCPPQMKLQPISSTLGEKPLMHREAAWHSVPPGGPAPPENSQGIPSPGEEHREENAGLGHGPPGMETWELRGGLQSVQRELAQCTEQRDQAVTKVRALERRVQQLLEELRGQRQRAGAMQRCLEQQEKEHRQELAELEWHHREALEQQGTWLDIPVPPHHPPNKGLGGSEQERRHPGCGQRSLSSFRQERAPEKRGAAGKVRGSSPQGPRVVGRLVPSGERGQEPESPTELQALRAEVLGLRRRLAAFESLRKGLLETCWQLRQGTRDLTGERRALAEMPLAHDAAIQHKEEAEELQGAPGPGLAKGNGGELQALAVESEAQVWGAPGPGLAEGDAQEVGELQVLRGELRALALGKAEAEAQAAQAQERLRRLQETLGLQTERLALACEAQSQHVAELLTEGHEREQELERLGQALREAGRVRELLEAEVGRLQVLLGVDTPPTGSPEPPPNAPKPGPAEPPPTAPEPGPAEPPPTAPEPGPAEPPPTAPDALELAVVSRMWLARKQAWHSARAPLQNILWELQKLAGQAGLQEQLEEALSHLLQENQALRAELALWQSHTREEFLQTAWLGVRDAQTQTEGPARGRRHRELISAAFDHTQYEPYGLPEVVMKGFADIPSGPSCPYVLRRGLLGSTPLAQLAPKAEPEEDPAEPDMGTSI